MTPQEQAVIDAAKRQAEVFSGWEGLTDEAYDLVSAVDNLKATEPTFTDKKSYYVIQMSDQHGGGISSMISHQCHAEYSSWCPPHERLLKVTYTPC